MVNIYTEFRDENGFVLAGRTKLFIIETLEDGSIHRSVSGLAYSVEENGTQFIVDEWLIEQLDKVQFIDGMLSVKDGEELIPPVKTEKELQIEAVERQLAALKAEPDLPEEIEEGTELPVEELADTEEQTEEVFNEYDEIINDDFRQKPTE